jgi:hypothetical protein
MQVLGCGRWASGVLALFSYGFGRGHPSLGSRDRAATRRQANDAHSKLTLPHCRSRLWSVARWHGGRGCEGRGRGRAIPERLFCGHNGPRHSTSRQRRLVHIGRWMQMTRTVGWRIGPTIGWTSRQKNVCLLLARFPAMSTARRLDVRRRRCNQESMSASITLKYADKDIPVCEVT